MKNRNYVHKNMVILNKSKTFVDRKKDDKKGNEKHKKSHLKTWDFLCLKFKINTLKYKLRGFYEEVY